MKPIIDNATVVFITVFCIAVASLFWFFPNFSEVNFVRAVGNDINVNKVKAEAKKLKIESIPISAWVRAFVFVTIM